MIRSVYCPSEDLIKEAEELAAKHALPITIGESESMSGLEFDRNSVCVVHIPTIHVFGISSSQIPAGLTQSFSYMCDYVDMKMNGFEPTILVEYGEEFSKSVSVEPYYLESHIAKFTHRFYEIGVHRVSVFVGKEVYAKDYFFEVTE